MNKFFFNIKKVYVGVKHTDLILLGSPIIYVLIYFIFYPKIYAIFDEACYLDLTYALREGTIYLDKANIGIPHLPIKSNTHLACRYPVGNSLLLLPFTLAGFKSIFLYGLFFHIVGYIIFIKVLRQLKINPQYAILYLFYPPYVLFSRTILSDIPAAFFFLLGFYSYQKERYSWSGISFGLSFLIRYANAILLPCFLIVGLIRSRWRGLKILVGFLLFVVLALFYNRLAYGGALKTGYFLEIGSFGVRNIITNFPIYLSVLTLVYPLMILAPFLYKGPFRLEIFTSCILFLLFYGICPSSLTLYAIPSRGNLLKVMVIAVRYFFPLIPLFLIGYSALLRKHINRQHLLMIWIGLIVLAFGIHFGHNKYLQSQVKFRDAIYKHTESNSLIIANGEVSELISRAWGKRRLIFFDEIPQDFSIPTKEKVYIASLIKYDRPEEAVQIRVLRDSFFVRVKVKLIEEIKGFDKKLELYEVMQ